MNIIFADKNPAVIQAYKHILGDRVHYITCDINTAHQHILLHPSKYGHTGEPIYGIVSPANSHGYMDGGIDQVLRTMFPKIDIAVRNRIKELYPDTRLIPIGQVISVPITNSRDNIPIQELIVCPTMVTPADIRGTDNVYLAFLGLLNFLNDRLVGQRRIKHTKNVTLAVIVPGFGTLTGLMDPVDSATQILRAFNDYQRLH